MSAVRLVREQVSLSDVVGAVAHLKSAVRSVMPEQAEVRVCVTGSDEIMVEVLVPIFHDREAALFNIRSGIVPGYSFHAIRHGLEHGMRGRHKICALVDL